MTKNQSIITTDSFYVLTPNNNVRGPFASLDEAQQNIPDSHGENLADHVTDMTACSANICAELPEAHRYGAGVEIEHLESWVRDADDDADESGYLVFVVRPENE